jgi:2,3-bisphosphoglycerate-dependent phosphoglycerate mutase
MKRIIPLLITLTLYIGACQPQREPTDQLSSHYRFILMRHAEKVLDGTKDPALTEKGEARAVRLAELLDQEDITGLFATPYLRTQSTLRPLADSTSMRIQDYTPHDPEFLIGLLAKYPDGGLFVIAGHSNSTPKLVNQLIGEDQFEPLDETDYNDLFIVQLTEMGKGSAIQLTY